VNSEEYIHLRDAVTNNGNINPNALEKMVILTVKFTASSRYMNEYVQDTMIYIRAYGRPDLFNTFTYNSMCDEMKELLFLANKSSLIQSSSDRHDITTRVCKQKLKSFIDFIANQRVFDDTRY